MDGGDASCEEADRCGKGQVIDIQQLSSKHFSLTPGHGGEHKCSNEGGGVLVNEAGPRKRVALVGGRLRGV